MSSPLKSISPRMQRRVASVLAFEERWNSFTDHDRSKHRAASVRRLITFWELVKTCRTWTPITVLHPKGDQAERRWVRRTIYTLGLAGLVEVDPPVGVFHPWITTQVRVSRKWRTR